MEMTEMTTMMTEYDQIDFELTQVRHVLHDLISRLTGTFPTVHCFNFDFERISNVKTSQKYSGPSPSSRVTRSHNRSLRGGHPHQGGARKRNIDYNDDPEVIITTGDDRFSLDIILSGANQPKLSEIIKETPQVLRSRSKNSVVHNVKLACIIECVTLKVLHRKEKFMQRIRIRTKPQARVIM